MSPIFEGPQEAELREEIVRIGRLLFEFTYTSGTGGNISARLGGGEFLVTPSKVNKGFLAPGDVVAVDSEGTPHGPAEPSSELKMHLAVYAALEAPRAAIHAHPPYATAFAIRGEAVETACVPEALVFLGEKVPLVPYATPSTEEMAENLREVLDEKTPAYLLQNHGVLVFGRDLQDAFNNLQTLELYARQLTIARLSGQAKPISKERLDEIRDIFDL